MDFIGGGHDLTFWRTNGSQENAILADYITSKIVRCAPKRMHRMYDLFILQRNA